MSAWNIALTVAALTWGAVAIVSLLAIGLALLSERIIPWLFDDMQTLDLPGTRDVVFYGGMILVWPIAILIAVVWLLATENRWAKARRRTRTK